jgi:hypothetical protein
MKIFDIEGTDIVLDPQVLALPPFKELWDRDTSESKFRAYSEIKYVTFLCDMSYDNKYRGYPEDERIRVLKRDFFKDEEWEPDEVVLEAIDKFNKFQQTVNSRLLKSAQKASDKLAEYFEDVDFKAIDQNGRPIYSADSLMNNLEKLARVTRSLKLLEEEVLREQAEATLARGGSEIGEFEIPDPEDEI